MTSTERDREPRDVELPTDVVPFNILRGAADHATDAEALHARSRADRHGRVVIDL